jgi:hypothetical protein
MCLRKAVLGAISFMKEAIMAVFSMHDVLRHLFGGKKKNKSAFKSEKEAYDFCRGVYKRSGGVPLELQRSYEFYLRNYNDHCTDEVRPAPNKNKAAA